MKLSTGIHHGALAAMAVMAVVMASIVASAEQPDMFLRSVSAPPMGWDPASRFGQEVALNDNFLAVSDPAKNVRQVRVFSAATHSLQLVLTDPIPDPLPDEGEILVQPVALSGSRLVRGIPRFYTAATNTDRVYLYDLAGTSPAQPVLTFVNPTGAANELFGASVGISGNFLIIGVHYNKTIAPTGGIVYIYDLAGDTPTVPIHTLKGAGASAGQSPSSFGSAVAISGTVVAIGASNEIGSGVSRGAVYIYDLSNLDPTVPRHVLANPTPGDGYFGQAVALDGLGLVVGAPSDDSSGNNRGIAYYYDLASANPTTPAVVLRSLESSVNHFGSSVALSGTKVVIGPEGGGKAIVFDVGGAIPSQPLAVLENNGEGNHMSVAIAGDRVAVGSTLPSGTEFPGDRLYLHDLTSATPANPTVVLSGSGPQPMPEFASATALVGRGTLAGYSPALLVGAPGDGVPPLSPNDPGLPNVGRAFVYSLSGSGGVLSPREKTPSYSLANPTPAAGDMFGYAVAGSDSRGVVGAPGDDAGAPNAGSVYLYTLNLLSLGGTAPAPMIISNPEPGTGDQFGSALAVSVVYPVTRLVIGAKFDDVGAADAGSAYVYSLSSFNSPTPTAPLAILRNPSPGPNDEFGASVGISGLTVVVGSPRDDAGALNAGSVYVYDVGGVNPTAPTILLQNPNIEPGGGFGHAVGISGNFVVVGSHSPDPGVVGKVFVYDLSSASPGVPFRVLNNPVQTPGDGFGAKVAISGTRVLVGAPHSGRVYVYDVANPSGAPVVTFLHPDPTAGAAFGSSVAIDGTTTAVGSAEPDPTRQGAVHLFVPSWGLAEATDFGGAWRYGNADSSGYTQSNGYWTGQSVYALDGIDAVEGRLGSYQASQTWIGTIVTGPATLFFSYRGRNVGGGTRAGTYEVVVDGTNRTTLDTFPAYSVYPTDTGWKEAALEIPSGSHPVQWRLGADKGDSGARAYLDQVRTSNDPRPRITSVSKPATFFNTPFAWSVPISSSAPVTLLAKGLPPGLSVDPTAHTISGSPTAAGEFPAYFIARNQAGDHTVSTVFAIEPGSTTINEGLDAPEITFIPPLDPTSWAGVTGIGVDGLDSARGKARIDLKNNLSTVIEGPGTLSFWYHCGVPGSSTLGFVSELSVFLGIPPSQDLQAPTLRLYARTWTRATLALPAGPQTISFLPRVFPGATDVFVDRMAFVPPGAQEIVVESLPDNRSIAPGDGYTFGEVLTRGSLVHHFSLKNMGLAALNGIAISIDGVDAADFSVSTSPATSVAGPDGSSLFSLRFAPSGPGIKSATLRLASNDPDDATFEIKLSGTGLPIASQVVAQGSPATFVVDGSNATALQWQKDGVDIPGAVAPTFTIPRVEPQHIGLYTARITTGVTSTVTPAGQLEITGVPSSAWRALISWYPFGGGVEDMCRPNQPAKLVNTSEFTADPQRGRVPHLEGKGWAVPPLDGEPADGQGPSVYETNVDIPFRIQDSNCHVVRKHVLDRKPYQEPYLRFLSTR